MILEGREQVLRPLLACPDLRPRLIKTLHQHFFFDPFPRQRLWTLLFFMSKRKSRATYVNTNIQDQKQRANSLFSPEFSQNPLNFPAQAQQLFCEVLEAVFKELNES